mgnify:CR=1 FL=1
MQVRCVAPDTDAGMHIQWCIFMPSCPPCFFLCRAGALCFLTLCVWTHSHEFCRHSGVPRRVLLPQQWLRNQVRMRVYLCARGSKRFRPCTTMHTFCIGWGGVAGWRFSLEWVVHGCGGAVVMVVVCGRGESHAHTAHLCGISSEVMASLVARRDMAWPASVWMGTICLPCVKPPPWHASTPSKTASLSWWRR